MLLFVFRMVVDSVLPRSMAVYPNLCRVILIVLFGGRVCVCVLILCGWLREYVMALGASCEFCGRVC